VTVTGADLSPKEIRWSYPADLGVNVTAVVQVDIPEAGSPLPPPFSDVQPLVEQAIADYGATLGAGDDVLRLDIFAAVAAVDGVRSVEVTLTAPTAPGQVQPTGDVGVFVTQRALLTPIVTEGP
jgi:hypothetical protein